MEARDRVQHLEVLLVEDDEDDYLITEDLLSEIGGINFDLERVSHYESALEAIDGEITMSTSSATGSAVMSSCS